MWIKRDFQTYLSSMSALPLKVLKGPRQVGKTSLLDQLTGYSTIYFDDLSLRQFAQADPKTFFDQMKGPLVLDEASLAPNIFSELKRRVDEQRRSPEKIEKLDIWITGSNQTLLQKNVQESLAGRASYFDLNTLSIHEINNWSLQDSLLRGGWPELQIDLKLSPIRYLNDLISTFIEKDIVAAAGIEKREAFSRSLGLIAGRVGQLVSYSDIATNVGVDTTTVQSWISLLAQNGLLRIVPAYSSNINQRLIKTPKIYFEDIALASRLQGWSEILPLMSSPSFGHLVENIAVSEVSKFFSNQGLQPEIFFIRSKEKVEIDLLIQLPNQKYIAAEIKTTAQDWSQEQLKLADSLNINIIEKWILTPQFNALSFKNTKTISFQNIWSELSRVFY